MRDITRPDSKMPRLPHVKTNRGPQFKLAVGPKIRLGYPSAVRPDTKAAMRQKTTRPDQPIRPKLRIGKKPAHIRHNAFMPGQRHSP